MKMKTHIRIGHLKRRYRLLFWSLSQPKLALAELQELINFFPFEYSSYTMQERFAHLRVIISLLNGNIEDEIYRIEKSSRKLKPLKISLNGLEI